MCSGGLKLRRLFRKKRDKKGFLEKRLFRKKPTKKHFLEKSATKTRKSIEAL